MFRIIFSLLLLLAGMPLALADEVLTLAAAQRLSAQHPVVQADDERAQALAQLPDQLAALPDPRLSLNVLNLPLSKPSLSREAMTVSQLGIRQTIPWPGKRKLRAEAARAMAQAASLDASERRLWLRRHVALRWWNLFYLDRALDTVQRNQALMKQLIQIADSKYRTGQGRQSDILLAQLELSRLLDQQIVLKGARNHEQAALNSLLQRPADAAIVLPATVDSELPPLPAHTALLRMAEQHRPWLQAQRLRIDASEARLREADKDYYPDLDVGAFYGLRAGRSDLAGVMLSMNLPIFTEQKQDHAVAQRQAEKASAQFTLEDRRLRINEALAAFAADYRASWQQALLLKTGLIPQAEQTVAAMRAAYQVGEVDFLNLVRARITLYNHETEYWQAISKAWQAVAQIEAETGTLRQQWSKRHD